MALTAIYDGHCVICNTTRRVVTALDWREQVEFLDLHDWSQIEARYPFMDPEQAMGQIHVIDGHENIFAGFAGTRRLLRALPLGLPLYGVLRLPVIGNWLGPRVYAFIAKHRYRINQLLGVDLATQQQEEADCEDGICKIG